MGKKSSKATKKFQKAHLGRELTQRKHDQKKKAIREKGMAKYVEEHAKGGPALTGKETQEEEEDELAVPEAARTGAEREVFTAKAKLKPSANAAHKLDRRPAAAASSAASAGGYTKPASKKAPSIEDLEGVESFMDAGYLDDDAEPQVDQSAIEDGDDEDGDEDGDAAMDGDAGSDEEDADGDAADAAEGDAESAALLAEIEAHEAELANLATTDPEFYSHLKQHDKSLLDFNKEDEMADEDDADAEEDAERDEHALRDEQEGGAGKKELEVLDWASLKSLQSQVIGPVWSLRALKKLIRIFRGAVHIGEIASNKGGKVKAISEKQAEKEAAFRQEARIDSPRVYNELIRFTLKEAAKIWAHHFKPEGAAAAGKGKKDSAASAASASSPAVFSHLDKHPKWSTLGPVLKAFLGHVLHFLTSLHANPRMARFVLGALEPLVILLDPFPKLAAKVLRELLAFWSQSEKDVRIDAFLRIRQMAIELSSTASRAAGGESMLELVLKGIYLTYVRNSKFSGELTLPVIEFMANCVVELYGLEPTLAYQYAFVYIRQCAIHLRTALMVKKKDAHRAVYNWNFINCLRVWGKVLAVHGVSTTSSKDAAAGAQDNLSALVYPYVQICLGTLGVMQSSRYFPLRFHVVRMLLDLARAVGIFVPLAPYLLSVLHAPELAKKPTSSTKKQADIAFILKVSPGILATKACQEVFVAEALALLLSYFEIYSASIAFPELILPALKILRKTQKDIVVHRIRKQIQSLVLKLEHNASWIIQKRNGTAWTPRDMMERKKGVDGLRTFDPKLIGSEGYAAAASSGKNGAAAAANQQAPLTKYVSVALEERRKIDEAKADWDGSRGSRAEPKGKKGAAAKDSDDEDAEEERQEKYERKNRGGGDDDDDEDDEEDGEGMDDDEEGDEDENDEDEEDDAPKSKKARKDSSASSAVQRSPFSYPSGLDAEAAEGEGDMLQELAFSDDEDEDDDGAAPKRKQKKQSQQKSKQTKQQGKSAPKPKSAANGVKRESGAGAGSLKKPQQQQQQKKQQSTKKPQQQAGKRKRD